MLLGLILYLGIGAGLAVVTLCLAGFRRRIDGLAIRLGMDTGYGRKVWLGGTIAFWPIGLFVLATGRLFMTGSQIRCAATGIVERDKRP